MKWYWSGPPSRCGLSAERTTAHSPPGSSGYEAQTGACSPPPPTANRRSGRTADETRTPTRPTPCKCSASTHPESTATWFSRIQSSSSCSISLSPWPPLRLDHRHTGLSVEFARFRGHLALPPFLWRRALPPFDRVRFLDSPVSSHH